MNEVQALEAQVVQTGTSLAPATYTPDVNPALVYLSSLSEGSRRTMHKALNDIASLLTGDACEASTMPWGAIRYQHTQAIRTDLSERYSAATANKMLSALRGVLKNAWRLGYMNAEEYQRAIDIQAVKGEKPDQAAGRSLSSGEMVALMNACAADESPKGDRDAAILAAAYAGGLRRSELASLTIADYDADEHRLTVRGKRNKTRTVYITSATDALADWLDVRGEDDGYLFTRVIKGGRVTGEGLTDQAIYKMMNERADEAGVKRFSPHDIRRTYAGDMLDSGVDISTVQKSMGHANANTTAGYDRRGERAKKEASTKLHVPWTKRR